MPLNTVTFLCGSLFARLSPAFATLAHSAVSPKPALGTPTDVTIVAHMVMGAVALVVIPAVRAAPRGTPSGLRASAIRFTFPPLA